METTINPIKQMDVTRPIHASGVTSENEKLKRVCGEFESLLLQYILKTGRATLPENDLLGQTHESKIYTSMLDEKVAMSVSMGGGTGLGDLLYRQLSRYEDTSTHKVGIF